VSVVPRPGGSRLVCHRDERRARPLALPPRRTTRGRHWADYPIDPQGGGTWIGTNEAGLALVLLNRSGGDTESARSGDGAEPPARPSRGSLIPALLHCANLDTLIRHVTDLELRRFAPFRLVAIARRCVAVIDHGPGALSVGRAPLVRPLFFTSSSLGDDLADAHRRPWFDRLVLDAPDAIEGQRRLHDRGWTSDSRFGVLLSREGVRTVSRTIVDVRAGLARMRYQPIDLSPRAS
jgi:hypothetical protein